MSGLYWENIGLNHSFLQDHINLQKQKQKQKKTRPLFPNMDQTINFVDILMGEIQVDRHAEKIPAMF